MERIIIQGAAELLAVSGLALVGLLFVRFGPLFGSPLEKEFYQYLSVLVLLGAGLLALLVYTAPASARASSCVAREE